MSSINKTILLGRVGKDPDIRNTQDGRDIAKPPFKRLLSNYIANDITGCWEWCGSITNSGYGQIKVFGKMMAAHRYSFALHKGPIPDGMEILHECDNKICINPNHLVSGTHKQNMSDAAARGLIAKGEKHPGFKKPGRRGIASSQAIPVRVKGKNYGSKKEAERKLGLGSGTVNYWIKNRPELASEITREEYHNVK